MDSTSTRKRTPKSTPAQGNGAYLWPASLLPADIEMFERLGVPPKLLAEAGVERVSDREAREKFGIRAGVSQDCSGLIYPYSSPVDGHRTTARLRRDHPEVNANGKVERKYLAPYGDPRHLYILRRSVPLLAQADIPVVLVEAEKSALALAAWSERTGRRIIPVAMGGCWGWRGRTGIDESPTGERIEVHGPLDDLRVCDGHTVLTLLDNNTSANPKVQQARAELIVEMNKPQRNCTVRVCDLPMIDGINGPDDYVAAYGDGAMSAVLDGAYSPADRSVRPVIDTRDERESQEPVWPLLPEAALYGLAGDVVRTIGPYTEADPAAILFQFIASAANAIGQHAYCMVESTRHPLIIDPILIGETSKARKGTSWDHVRRLLEQVDPVWTKDRVTTGLSSAEGLIDEVSDDADPRPDRRLLIVQSEFASVLRAMERTGNTLSSVMRQAWDGVMLRTMVTSSKRKATGARVGLIAHITRPELLRYLSDTEMFNGFANRLLFVLVRRSQYLPEGATVPSEETCRLIVILRAVNDWAEKQKGFEFKRDEEARKLWAEHYRELSDGRPGLLGAATSRGEAYVLRLSAVYALLDRSRVITVEHLKAAMACWTYTFQSAQFLFSDASGDPVADRICEALKNMGDEGLSRTGISQLFAKNVPAGRITSALTQLVGLGRVRFQKISTGGRPTEVWTTTK